MESEEQDELLLFQKLISDDINDYEIVKFENDIRPFIVDNGLLLLNKDYLKKLFVKSRAQLLSNLTKNFDRVSIFVLLLNANVHTAWSKRKELLHKGLITSSNELRINKMLLDKNPKSEHGLMHRRWILKHYHQSLFDSNQKFEEFFSSEFDFVFRLADKIKSNYYCWTYLSWLCDFGRDYFKFDKGFLFDKLKIHQNFVELHPSEYCVFHFRLNFIHLMLRELLKDDCGCLEKLLIDEYSLIDDIVTRYPRFMTIWNYRKYMLILLKPILIEKAFEKNWSEVFKKINENFSEFLVSNFNSIYLDRDIFEKQFKLKLFDISGDNLFQYMFKRDLLIYSMLPVLYSKSPDSEFISKYSSSNEKFLNKFLL